ncbi:hypothetical protein N9X72_00345 [Candidatus Poseidoniales archaeon]|nr:hypothetical protein [Candidatus Poseidoniales archaeon]MDC0528137.1 hypothetical protein [Candidatus Poseidoniaceae archaeon]
MASGNEDEPQSKFSAISEKGKEFFSKSVEVTKSSSKKAFEVSKKLTQDGMEQAKEGLTTLTEKKDEYLAKRDAKKLEQSITEFETENKDSFVTKLKEKSKRMKFKPKLSELELIQEQMKQIEHDFPTVLSEENNLPILPPKKAKKWPNLLAASLLSFFAVITLFHTLYMVSGSDNLGFLGSVLEFLVPSWLSNSTSFLGFSDWPLVLGVTSTTLLLVCAILTLLSSSLSPKLLAIHYGAVLCLGQVVMMFYSDTVFDEMIVFDTLRDLLKAIVLVGIARSPKRIIDVTTVEEAPTIFEYSGILSKMGEKSNTSDELGLFIEVGLSMDFRTEVAKPKPPRARAKFETYEVILLCASFVLWPSTIIMTMALDNGLDVFTEYSSGPIQVVSMWALSLFTLLALVRFDRSARGNGWYAKEKETYVGMMDLYSKAQAKHYEYVELRAAAEAQEILEKYPQLDKSKSSVTAKA